MGPSSQERARAEEVFDDFLMRMDDQVEALRADAARRGTTST
jgi:hypothetical protein